MAAKRTSDIIMMAATTKWYEGCKEGEDGSCIPLPRTIYEANMMFMKNINHPAMNMMGSSLKAHRSCNEAIIYLYGISGAGKSSTLNHLFNREGLIPVSSTQSCTSEVCEYVSLMESNHWRVSNLQIGFIDTPGWDDTRSKDMDAFNFALMENFITTHPHLGCKTLKIYPNIILIVLRAVDNRIIGKNAKTSQMLRAISQLDIVDTERPNVVFILTHAWAIPERKYTEDCRAQKKRMKQLSREFLGVTAPVVMIENKYVDNNLQTCGDFTLLRDGTKQPLNLYNAMKKQMKNCNDEVGIEAVRMFFGSRHLDGKIEKRHIVDEVRIDKKYIERCRIKWSEELSKNLTLNTKTEVALILDKFIRERRDEIYQEFPEDSFEEKGFFDPLFRVLESHNIKTFKELQKCYKQILKQKKCPLNNIEKYIVLNVLEIDNTIYSGESLGVIGKGFEWFCEQLAPKEVFKPVESDKIVFNSTLVKKIPIRYTVSQFKKLDVSYGRTSLIRSDCDSIANVRKYKEISDDVVCGFLEGFYFGVEEYIFTIALDFRNISLNSEFIKAVVSLPNEWEKSKSEFNSEFKEFFENYGYWVIIKGTGGGFLQGNYKPPNRNMPIRDIQLGIKGYIERLKNVSRDWEQQNDDNNYDMMRGIEQSSIQYLGGNSDEFPDKFGKLKSDQYLSWLESLSDQPVIFEHSLTTVPIYLFAKLVNNEKGKLVKEAFDSTHPDSANISYSNNDLEFSHLLANPQTNVKPIPPCRAKRSQDSFVIIENPQNKEETVESIQTNENENETKQNEGNIKSLPKVPIKPPNYPNPIITPIRPVKARIGESLPVYTGAKYDYNKTITMLPLRPPLKPKPKPQLMQSTSADSFKANQLVKGSSYTNLIIGEDLLEDLTPSSPILQSDDKPEPVPRRAVAKKNVMDKLEQQLSMQKRSSTISGPFPSKQPLNTRPVPIPRAASKHLSQQTKQTGQNNIQRNSEVEKEGDTNEIIDEDTREGQSIKSKSKINPDDGCFPSSSTVVLKGGIRIPIARLKPGDCVLSIDRRSLKPVYTKVYMWAHLNSTVTNGGFIQIHYEDGTLTLTPRHLLLCSPQNNGINSQQSAELMPAEKVRIGDLVYRINSTSAHCDPTPVVNVTPSPYAEGYYCPVTYNSMLIVDGVACSVWSLPLDRGLTSCHELAHWLFAPFRLADRLKMGRIVNHNLDQLSGKHRYCILLEKVYEKMKGNPSKRHL